MIHAKKKNPKKTQDNISTIINSPSKDTFGQDCKKFMLMKKKPAVEAEYLNCQEILQGEKWPEGAV